MIYLRYTVSDRNQSSTDPAHISTKQETNTRKCSRNRMIDDSDRVKKAQTAEEKKKVSSDKASCSLYAANATSKKPTHVSTVQRLLRKSVAPDPDTKKVI